MSQYFWRPEQDFRAPPLNNDTVLWRNEEVFAWSSCSESILTYAYWTKMNRNFQLFFREFTGPNPNNWLELPITRHHEITDTQIFYRDGPALSFYCCSRNKAWDYTGFYHH